jgi:hypothetical protein
MGSWSGPLGSASSFHVLRDRRKVLQGCPQVFVISPAITFGAGSDCLKEAPKWHDMCYITNVNALFDQDAQFVSHQAAMLSGDALKCPFCGHVSVLFLGKCRDKSLAETRADVSRHDVY